MTSQPQEKRDFQLCYLSKYKQWIKTRLHLGLLLVHGFEHDLHRCTSTLQVLPATSPLSVALGRRTCWMTSGNCRYICSSRFSHLLLITLHRFQNSSLCKVTHCNYTVAVEMTLMTTLGHAVPSPVRWHEKTNAASSLYLYYLEIASSSWTDIRLTTFTF